MKRATSDHWLARWFFIGILFAFVLFFLVFPVGVILFEALRGGSHIKSPRIHAIDGTRCNCRDCLKVRPGERPARHYDPPGE